MFACARDHSEKKRCQQTEILGAARMTQDGDKEVTQDGDNVISVTQDGDSVINERKMTDISG